MYNTIIHYTTTYLYISIKELNGYNIKYKIK